MSIHGKIDEFERLEERLKQSLKRTLSIKPVKLESVILYLGTNENYKISLELCKSIAKKHGCKVKLVCDELIFGEKKNQFETACEELLSAAYSELESEKISEIKKYIRAGETSLEDKLSEIIENPLELIIIPATPFLYHENVCSTNRTIESILDKFSNPILIVKKNKHTENLQTLKNILIAISDISNLGAIVSTTLAIADKKAKMKILKIMDDRFLNSVEVIMGAISDEYQITREEMIESVMNKIKKILDETIPKIAEIGYQVDYIMQKGE